MGILLPLGLCLALGTGCESGPWDGFDIGTDPNWTDADGTRVPPLVGPNDPPWRILYDHGELVWSSHATGPVSHACHSGRACRVVEHTSERITYLDPKGGVGFELLGCSLPADYGKAGGVPPPEVPAAGSASQRPTLDLPPRIDAKDLMELGLRRAQSIEPRSILSTSTFKKMRDGLVDTTQEDAAFMGFEYAYFDPTKPVGADLVRGVTQLRVSRGVLSVSTGAPATSRVAPGTTTLLPACSSADAWKSAQQAGIPADAVVTLTYWATWSPRPEWWFTVAGHDELRRVVDRVTCQASGAPGAMVAPRAARPEGVATPTASSDSTAAAECDAAYSLALGGSVALAIERYRKCSGPRMTRTLEAIDAAAIRKVKAEGCGAKEIAHRAAEIGAPNARGALPSSCRQGL